MAFAANYSFYANKSLLFKSKVTISSIQQITEPGMIQRIPKIRVTTFLYATPLTIR